MDTNLSRRKVIVSFIKSSFQLGQVCLSFPPASNEINDIGFIAPIITQKSKLKCFKLHLVYRKVHVLNKYMLKFILKKIVEENNRN